MRVGIYARVSTHDQQTLPMQLKLMREYIKNRKWKLAVEFQEIGSGAKTRPKREELLKMARRREIGVHLAVIDYVLGDLIVFGKLDEQVVAGGHLPGRGLFTGFDIQLAKYLANLFWRTNIEFFTADGEYLFAEFCEVSGDLRGEFV